MGTGAACCAVEEIALIKCVDDGHEFQLWPLPSEWSKTPTPSSASLLLLPVAIHHQESGRGRGASK